MMNQYLRKSPIVFFVLWILIMPMISLMAQDGASKKPISVLFPALSEEERTDLRTKGEVTRYYFESIPPRWMPKDRLGVDLLKEIEKVETVIGVESMHLLSYTAAGSLVPSSSEQRGDRDSLLTVYNLLLSVSTMKGLQYYSASRGRMRTLFAESYVIRSPEDPTPIPDPKVNLLPTEQVLFVFQEDLTFGKNITQWKYRSKGEELSISITNLTPMKYSFFTVADPGNMQIHLLVVPAEEGIVFYGCMVAKSPRFLGLEKTRTESFYNRIKALFTWFEKGLGTRSRG
ncbi:MAG: hypothetical protein N2442_04870 [Spirochaetes bacterium]|nr:hypothetical protein [Spirochaetota bacterium]